ncbi:MAG: hypothetical protein AUK34_03400 [Ignavibacteria bacterium CG2_30_36_16]|nr:hypothetical protein [Ignavibacteria bacterium]OIP62404.1 MAG: hypothetical protein AUK34_03400 [Ignavibacteria bacterium CG2_30_36_16]PJB01584.1 MAG: hypothetical protein CO127_03050 [Ignavibacteria bacterium CG_4_9_14_3_um_filter_36_18]
MNQYVIDARIKDGYLSLKDLPFKEETEVKVIVIPKINFRELSFLKVRELTKSIMGNISDDIISEREEE